MKQKEMYVTPQSGAILISPFQVICASIPQKMDDEDLVNEGFNN